jgi:hypothetical protein
VEEAVILDMITISADSARVEINPAGGHFDEVVFTVGGQELRPMHRAHWRTGENHGGVPETLNENVPQTLRSLAGDFFCAPFAKDDLTGGPEHGPVANGIWHEWRRSSTNYAKTLELLLDRTVLGAEVTKTITLRTGHPIIYQSHAFKNGSGSIPVAHHPMLRVDGGVRLSFSPKRFGATPSAAIETDPSRGRSLLAYPQVFTDLGEVRQADGGTVDLRSLPGPEGYEDFLLLVEAPRRTVGWSAILAPTQKYLFFILRDPRVLPVTMLWLSNGGRDYQPFNGRHRNVLGIEEGITFFNSGYKASIADNALTEQGIPTALSLDPFGTTEVKLAFGAIPAPSGWSEVAEIEVWSDTLVLRDVSGAETRCPFDAQLAGLE